VEGGAGTSPLVTPDHLLTTEHSLQPAQSSARAAAAPRPCRGALC
jgi:hypothetical protein